MTEEAFQIYLIAKEHMNPSDYESLAHQTIDYLIDQGGYDLAEIKESPFWQDEVFQSVLIEYSDGELEDEDDGLDTWGDEIDPYADPDDEELEDY